MSFMSGVWRMLGADDEVERDRQIVEYPSPSEYPKRAEQPGEALAIAELGKAIPTTICVLRPELNELSEPAYSAKDYSQHLLSLNIIFLDVNRLAAADSQLATRLVDYLSGVSLAINGTVYEVGKNIFVFAPCGTGLVGDPVTPIEVS